VHNKKLPKEVIDYWPEVFEDVEVEVVPVEYLHSVRVSFSDGVTWDIDIKKEQDSVNVEEALANLMDEYQESIVHIDFRLDTEKVKKDISKRTHIFMKKKK
jgi:hypothetical protein